jgi:uncharacterized protein YgiM (DUF1202 family)
MIFVVILSSLLAGCALPGAAESTPTISVDAIRTMAASTAFYSLTEVALLASPTPSPTTSEMPLPPSLTPTVEVKLEPIPGVATDNLSVRSEPRKGADNLGGIFYNQKVNVLARNDVATWYYILWSDSPDGKGWVAAGGVTLQNFDIGRLPIAFYDASHNLITLPPFIWEISGTPSPLPPVPSGDKIRPATVVQAANVRVCPSKGCMVMGFLQLGEQVNMTGRYGDNEWAQIDYPSGPGGKGWIAREALQPSPEGFGSLPYFNAIGTPITPEPPTSTPDPNLSPTPSDTPAPTPAGPAAQVLEQTIVYSQPSSLSSELGTLNKNEKIYITGQSLNGLWYQIQYPAFSDGRAYVSQKYIRVLGDMRKLPYFDNLGTPIPTP